MWPPKHAVSSSEIRPINQSPHGWQSVCSSIGMTRRQAYLALAAGMTVAACAHTTSSSRANNITPSARRLAAIRHAQVWAPTDVASMDLRAGPQGPGAFTPDELVSCEYADKKMSGRSPKFTCVKPPHDEMKVKYGRQNGEVFAEVASSRLLWALGFAADRMYPVRVVCHGCPPEIQGTDVASIQRKAAGHEITTPDISGWEWPELDLVDPRVGGAPKAQRDALALLAVFIQHTDSKAEQQRLLCLDSRATKEEERDGLCQASVMMVHDLGLTFGHANTFNRNIVGSTNLEQWSSTPVWTLTTGRCVANMPASQTGTLNNPPIAEEGRAFLADLLMQLTDAQLHDLFEVSRFPRRGTVSAASPDTSTVAQWVDAFKKKRTEIVNRTCPF